MGLKEQLRQDLQDAMRARDPRRKSALRMILSAIQLAEVEQTEPLTDQDVVVIIRKEVKRREEALAMMQDADRDDLVEVETVELDILRSYLPQQMSAEEIRAVAQRTIDDVGASSPRDLGRVMGALMPQLRGKADGRVVNQVVRELLSA